ncbi:MAG: hypothetical protein QW501_01610 [Zestosphaera sp.]
MRAYHRKKDGSASFLTVLSHYYYATVVPVRKKDGSASIMETLKMEDGVMITLETRDTQNNRISRTAILLSVQGMLALARERSNQKKLKDVARNSVKYFVIVVKFTEAIRKN